MTRPLETLHPAALDDSVRAAHAAVYTQVSQNGVIQAMQRAGIPQQAINGKVIVLVGFNTCGSHDFGYIEKLAQQKGAQIYVINGWPDGKALGSSRIGVPNPDGKTSHALRGTVVSNLKTPEQVAQVAGQLGLFARVDRTGPPAALSTGAVLIDHGRIVERFSSTRAEIETRGPHRA